MKEKPEPADPAYAERVRACFARQRVMSTLGAELAPAQGEAIVARGRVVRAGRTLTVCQADVVAIRDGVEIPVAILMATVMTVRDRPGLTG